MAMELRGASGDGFATITANGSVLDSWFLQPRLVSTDKTATVRLTKQQAPASFVKMAES